MCTSEPRGRQGSALTDGCLWLAVSLLGLAARRAALHNFCPACHPSPSPACPRYSGSGPYDADSFTFWLGSFGAGQAFSHAKAPGLVLRASTLAAGAASLTVCRKSASGAETADTCLAGLDGDCDGMVGRADGDCARFLAPPPR
jgi:hypothetical protein